MKKVFHRALLLCPEKYSLANVFVDILGEIASEVSTCDIQAQLGALDLRLNAQAFRLPFSIRNAWERRIMGKANILLNEKISIFRPDLIIVYNSEFLLPDTCAKIKKSAKLVFFMGDSPFFTPLNNFYLTCLSHADLILSPDSFWNNQLKTIGLQQTLFYVPGMDQRSYFPIAESDELEKIEETDVLYVGSSYVNSWGYKKALLMSQFTPFLFRLHGNEMWRRWFKYFPELEPHFYKTGFIPISKMNLMYNRTRMIPVDGNPGILNGFHLRLFEALASGALPLVEYRKDVAEMIFKGCSAMVPLIHDYSRAGELTAYYLKNDGERVEIVNELRRFISERYNARTGADRLLNELKPL